jgi:hypothetical protein
MNRVVFAAMIGSAGLLTGAASAFGTTLLLAKNPPAAAPASQRAFVPAGPVLAPLVFADGRLSGYVSFRVALEVPADRSGEVASRLPLLYDAITMRAYRTPIASGPEGALPNVAVLRALVMDASGEAFGKGLVQRVAILEASPA